MIRFIIILILGFFLFGCAKDSITDSPNKQAFNQTVFFRSDVYTRIPNAQMFSCLTPFVFTVTDYHNCIIANHLGSTGNTVSQVNDLFDSY